jgi:hypothetical protein
MWALVFVPIETYLSFRRVSPPISGYVVNVLGAAITLWAVWTLRRGRQYAEGLLATGWGWTTAVFWRATNLRYSIARDGRALDFGNLELWLAPLFTLTAGAALVGSILLLVNRDRWSRP